MKTILFTLAMILSLPALSAVKGSTIPNAFVVFKSQDAAVIRGRAPGSEKQLQELIRLGVTEFLIFKNDVKGEVDKEQMKLQELGVANESITNIPFPWKDLNDFGHSCEMTVQALRTIEIAVENNRSIYFHCTAGEDRTGYLAGLWGLWSGTYKDVSDSVESELCARGYEAGNPNKPFRAVVQKIRETLTPTYLKMVMVLAHAKRNGLPLDESLCSQEPELKVDVSRFYCANP